jgi:hypothetical protein
MFFGIVFDDACTSLSAVGRVELLDMVDGLILVVHF